MYILGITYKRNHENNITHRISLITLRQLVCLKHMKYIYETSFRRNYKPCVASA